MTTEVLPSGGAQDTDPDLPLDDPTPDVASDAARNARGGSAPPSDPVGFVIAPQAGPTGGEVVMGGPLTITLPQGVNTTNSTAITATLASPDSNPWRWIFSAPEAGVPDPAWEFSRELQVSESFAWPLAPAQSELLVTVTATATAHAFSFPINDGTAGTISILISRASPTG